MSSDSNGLKTAWENQPFPTPDVGGTGLNGMGDSFDQPSGGSGLIATPFDQAIVRAPSGEETPGNGDLPKRPKFIDLPGGKPAGSQLPDSGITHHVHTIDKRND